MDFKTLNRTASISIYKPNPIEEEYADGDLETESGMIKYTFSYPETMISISTTSDAGEGSDGATVKIYGIGVKTANKMIRTKEEKTNTQQKAEIFIGNLNKKYMIFSGYVSSITYVSSGIPYLIIKVLKNVDLYEMKMLNLTMNENSTRKDVALEISNILKKTAIWVLKEERNIPVGKRTISGSPRECLLEIFPKEDGLLFLPDGDKLFFYEDTSVFTKEFILSSYNGMTEFPTLKEDTNFLIKSILIPEIDATTVLKIPTDENGDFSKEKTLNFRRFRVLNYAFTFEDKKDSAVMECEEIV